METQLWPEQWRGADLKIQRAAPKVVPFVTANVCEQPLAATAEGFDRIHFFSDKPDSVLLEALRSYGCTVTTNSLETDVSGLLGRNHSAIVLDVSHLSRGFNFCRQLRERGVDLPLVTLATEIDPFDEVLALELGTDEVIGRHVHPRVFLARLRALSRRSRRSQAKLGIAASILRFGQLQVDGENREVTLRGTRIRTTSGEFDLLWMLAQSAGSIIHRDDVLKRLRGLAGAHGNRSIDARLYRLRQRFADVPDVAARIKSVRPYGYMFVNAPW